MEQASAGTSGGNEGNVEQNSQTVASGSSGESLLGGTTEGSTEVPDGGGTQAATGASAVPEAYEPFVIPQDIEGVVADESVTSSFGELARELNLTQAQAQKLYEYGARHTHKAMEDVNETLIAQMLETRKKWHQESESDQSIMADVPLAKRVVQRFGSKELGQLLIDTGVGSHKAMIRFVAEIGKAIGEAPLHMPGAMGTTGAADITDPRTVANSMYANKM